MFDELNDLTLDTEVDAAPDEFSRQSPTRTQRISEIIQDASLFLSQHPTPPRFGRGELSRRPVRTRIQPTSYGDQVKQRERKK